MGEGRRVGELRVMFGAYRYVCFAISRTAVGVVLGALLLASCSGGGASSGGVQAQAFERGTVAMTFPPVVTSSSSASRKRPQFLSPSTASVSIAVTGVAAPVIASVAANSPNCTAVGAGRACTVTVSAPVGSSIFTVKLYDGANATGNLLGTGTGTATVTSGSPFTVAIGVTGVAGSIDITATQATFVPGTAATTPLTVTLHDADGNVITGTYATPVTLTDSDTTGAFTLSATSVTSSTQTVTLKYNGSGAVTGATISADAAGVAAGSVTAQTVAVSGTPPITGHLYVNDDTYGLLKFNFPLTNASVPTILENAPQNVWLAFDPRGNAFIDQYFGSVEEFATPYTGAPIASYAGAGSGDPYGLAVDANENVFVAEAEANIVIELSSITGTVVNTISAPSPYALALDASGKLYIGTSNGVTVYAPPYNGTSLQTIEPGDGVQGIAFDSRGDIFVGGDNKIVVLAPPYGVTNTIATITTGLGTPLGLAVDSAGNVYAPNYGIGTITAYAPPYTAGPFATITESLPDADAIGP